MCYQTSCKECNKPTWAGCGNHIEKALADVPVPERCQCKMSMQAPVRIKVAFSGGLELLFSKQRSMNLSRPVDSTVSDLINHMATLVTPQTKRDLFMQDDDQGTVRPGILVLINDSDWELEGEGAYKLQDGDEILFVSTLHGG